MQRTVHLPCPTRPGLRPAAVWLLACPCGDTALAAVKPHHTHACQHCGHVWRVALVCTLGVQFFARVSP